MCTKFSLKHEILNLTILLYIACQVSTMFMLIAHYQTLVTSFKNILQGEKKLLIVVEYELFVKSTQGLLS